MLEWVQPDSKLRKFWVVGYRHMKCGRLRREGLVERGEPENYPDSACQERLWPKLFDQGNTQKADGRGLTTSTRAFQVLNPS